MEQMKILIVEDDVDINGLLYRILEKNGYQATSAFSGSEAKLCLQHSHYDLALLDLMLPGCSGEQLVTEIREKSNIPILIISAKTALEDKVSLLKLGADDYITKPFEISEVLARVEAQLRRYYDYSPTLAKPQTLTYKGLTIEEEARKVTLNQQELNLTGREYELLLLLMQNPNKVYTRENLYHLIWKDEFYGEDNTVNVHISNLRLKLQKIEKETEYIKTVWGIGFKLAE